MGRRRLKPVNAKTQKHRDTEKNKAAEMPFLYSHCVPVSVLIGFAYRILSRKVTFLTTSQSIQNPRNIVIDGIHRRARL